MAGANSGFLGERCGLRKFVVLTIVLCLTLPIAGCFLSANREINLLVTRSDTGLGSEVTVTYRMPPPEDGNVYVLWLLNADLGKTTRVGTIEPSRQLRAIKTKADFWVTAAVVSIESSPNVLQMSNTWELASGETKPSSGAITTKP